MAFSLEKERSKGRKSPRHARATLTRRPGRRNMIWSRPNDTVIPSAGRTSLLYSLFPPPAYRSQKALVAPYVIEFSCFKEQPWPATAGAFSLSFSSATRLRDGVTHVNRIDAKALRSLPGSLPL